MNILKALHGRLYTDLVDGAITALVIAFAAIIGWLVLLGVLKLYDHIK